MYSSREIALSALSEVVDSCGSRYSDEEKKILYKCLSILGREEDTDESCTPISERISYALNVYDFFRAGFARGATVTGWMGSKETKQFDNLYADATRLGVNEERELKVPNENTIYLYYVGENNRVEYEKRKCIAVEDGYILYSEYSNADIKCSLISYSMFGSVVKLADSRIVVPLACKDCSFENSFVRTVLRNYYGAKKKKIETDLEKVENYMSALK